MYTPLYLHFDICLYILKTMSSQWYLKSLSNTTVLILDFILFHIYNYLLWQWDSWLPYSVCSQASPAAPVPHKAALLTCWGSDMLWYNPTPQCEHPSHSDLALRPCSVLPHPSPYSSRGKDLWCLVPTNGFRTDFFRKQKGKGLCYSCVIWNKTHLPSAYLKIAILSFLNFLFPIFKSSLFHHVFFTYYFQIVPCPGHGTWPVVPFGHTSINVATRMEHILYTLIQRSRERWAVTLELLLKSLGCVGPGGRSLLLPGFVIE